jgi:uncharacterized repeat protein (TIGR02543 family)
MKKNLLLLIIIAILLALAFSACTSVDFDDLTISVESVEDIPEGEYTLEYSISDLDKYSEIYDLDISVKVFDDNNSYVTVSNNRTFSVESNNIYYVTVYVETSVNGVYQTKSRSFTVTAIHSDPFIIMKLLVLESIYEYKTFTVTYGESYDIQNIDSVPVAKPTADGYDYILEDSYWFVLNDLGQEETLSQEHLNDITSDIYIYAYYDYKLITKQCTISFDSMGGTEVESITQAYSSSVVRPEEPTKDGYFFCGWYEDAELTTIHPWLSETSIMSTSLTLYAKWMEYNNSTGDEYFTFTETNDGITGYKCYEIKANDAYTLSGDIIIPNGYDNAPVTIISEYGFSYSDTETSSINSIFIPDTITSIKTNAFQNCANLSSINISECNISLLTTNLFQNCTSLTEIIVPDTVTDIKGSTFDGCSALETITFNSTSMMENIYDGAFEDTIITTITLPYSMSDISDTYINANGDTIEFTFYEEIIE